MTRKRLRILALAFPATQCVVGQWSHTYSVGTFANAGAIAPDSTIVVAGAADGFWGGPVLIQLNGEGDTLVTRFDQQFGWMGGRSGAIEIAYNGDRLVAGNVTDTASRAALFRFGPAWDSLQLVLVGSTSTLVFTSLDVSADSSVWAFGNSQQPYDYLAVRFNPQLHLQDSVRYFSAPDEYCGNGISTLDGGFAIAGVRVLSSTDWNMHVTKADVQGNIQWERSIGDDWFELGGFITQAADTSYYVAGGYRWPNVLYSRSTLVQLNSAGVPQWYCVVPTSGSSWLLSRPVATDDGRVLAAGKSLMNGSYRGQLMCADTSGALLWERTYATDTTAHNAFLDMVPHPDGGFVLVGQATDTQTGDERPWVVRTDSVGCLVPGCDVIDGVQQQRTDLSGTLHVFPNPAAEVVSIALHLPVLYTGLPLQLTVVDAMGRVLHTQAAQNDRAAEVAVDHLAAGTYFIHISHGAKWLTGVAVQKL